MIPVPSGVRVWIATGHTDMRRGMNGLALQVQQGLKRDPHAGDLFVFRGRRGDLIKILWHDGLGMSLYAKRLEHGRFIWRRRRTASLRSRRHNWLICSKALTGATRNTLGVRTRLDRVRQVDSPIAREHHNGVRLWLNRLRADYSRHSPRRGRCT
jgi:transposase